jgi:xanthine dehydrogenase small subunit
VDYHGSQCGFCTPGFVMSLYGCGCRSPILPTKRSKRRCRAISVAAPAMSRSSALRARCRPTGTERHRRARLKRDALPPAWAMRDGAARRDRRGQPAARRARLGRRSGGGAGHRACRDHRCRVHRCRPLGDQVHARDIAGGLHRRARGIAGDLRGGRRVTIGAGVTYSEARTLPGAAYPGARPAHRPDRRRAGAQHGHDRRQCRQRLADRRHAAAADRARRDGDTCAGARSGAPCRWRISSSPTASRTVARRIRRSASRAAAPDGAHFAVYKVTKRRDEDITATLGAFRLGLPRTARSARHRASPMAAWRRRRSVPGGGGIDCSARDGGRSCDGGSGDGERVYAEDCCAADRHARDPLPEAVRARW